MTWNPILQVLLTANAEGINIMNFIINLFLGVIKVWNFKECVKGLLSEHKFKGDFHTFGEFLVLQE